LLRQVGPVLDREAAVFEGVHDADWRRGFTVGAVCLLLIDFRGAVLDVVAVLLG
jgi:hypothetical protein